MKKRMFLTTILMTLVLLVAVTTATFAWYSVEAAGHSTANATNNTITTAENDYAAGSVKFSAQLGTPSNLAVQLSDKDGKTFYWLGETKVEDTESTLASKYGVITLDLIATKQGEDQASLAEILSSLDGKVVTVTISGTAGMKFQKATPTAAEDGWKGETVSYSVEIDADKAVAQAADLFEAVEFYYGFDGNVIEDVKAAGTYVITATVSVN